MILAWRLTPRVETREQVLALELAMPDLVPKLAGLLASQTVEDFCDANAGIERHYRAWTLIERAIAPIRLSELAGGLAGLDPDAYLERFVPDDQGRVVDRAKN